MDQEDKEIKFSKKILVIGEAGVGKSAIIQKYVNNFYPEMYKQSLGCNFFSKQLDLSKTASVTLSIWDCSSESLKSKMLNTYIYGSDAVLFVYDITNRSSFDSIRNIMKLVQSVLIENNDVEYCVLGNKNDLFNQIAVEEDQAKEMCKILNLPYYSVSAKMGSNLNECFKNIAYKVCKLPFPSEEKKNDKSLEGSIPDLRSEVKGSNGDNKTSSGCNIF
ncbi:small guanosine triphosphatase family Ras-related in brain (Rab) family protein (macronuclear) [Tetrahymena thermophila SB210]|uniref:Small guanosine triphosphatase family Ras-related in brain (Rab) family protein n=2 Tax=Tetrahymena thermophila TaxID=5911 RepID=Q22AT0_TETTS|nr:small guanosine triphosphatase family Ras-related in brain (Rab) family protein [Tetrahymena thermophila SB210]EAR82388.2 small guanosine triphosphatase family Ras-related in brain (Rab) family protein [Tetrahymena thermophila SB210]BAJ21303.1 Rab-family small GTPase RabX8 [Tetrahymena thermophila]|eukprot:XP_001030051.2 small guanosine triphosphatase family Ras-related in brain (Rab) family protein [Tetrahymena thermophila SB210]